LTLIDSGSVPRTAIVKVASKRSLLPDQVDRLCQLYNRSNSIATRVGSDALMTKISAVDVVDPTSIRDELAEMSEKKSAMAANAKVAAMPTLNRVLSLPRSAEPPRPSDIPGSVKTAAAPVVEVDPTHGLFHGLNLKQAYAELGKLDARYQTAQRSISKLMVAAEVAGNCCMDVINAKVAAGADEFLQQLHYQLREHHPRVQWLGDGITQYAVSRLPSYKQAEFKLDDNFTPVEDLPYMAQAVDSIAKYAAALEALDAGLVEHSAESARCRELAWIIKSNLVDGGVKNSGFYVGDKTLADEQMEHVEKVASITSMFFGSQLGKLTDQPSEPKGSSKEDAFVLKLGTPQHEANLRAIRTRAALQQLMVDDPVISSTPEHEVIGAYNEIANYAPRAAETPAVLRSVLRQYLQNNASAMDLAAIRKLERTGDGERPPKME
jgi:hypothetical protein